MRKNRLFALAFGVLLVVALIAQPANAQTNQDQTNEDYPKAGFFFGAGISNGIFTSDRLPVYSDFDILQLNPIKIGAYYEIPLGIGNFFGGLEGGFASGSNFGGEGDIDFLPINANATFVFSIADILYIGPGLKLGVLGILGHDKYNILPLIGAGLDLELRYKYFPLSIYATGGVNAYPTSYSFNILPTVEVGIRFPRGAFGRGGTKEEEPTAALATGAQTGTAAQVDQPVIVPPAVAPSEVTPPVVPPPVVVPPAPTVTSLTVNPATATVNQGGTQQFTATVNGTNNPPQTVTWSVAGATAGTSISPTGLLTVGPNQNPGALTVTATSTADTSRTGTAAVTVPAPAPTAQLVPPVETPPPVVPPVVVPPSELTSTVTNIIVNPVTSVVPQGFEQQFSAVVTGPDNPPQTVTWSVTGAAAGTSINQNGLLTVGENQDPGALTVTATSTADTSKSGTSAVTVPAPTWADVPTVTNIIVNPVTSVVPQGFEQQFNAQVIGTNNPPQTVTWSVSGDIAGTSINENGLLTVGEDQDPGTLTVAATSTADTAMSGTSTVTVPSPTWADVPAVLDVTVIPATATVNQGGTQQFTASVTGINNPPQTVTWEVAEAAAGTSIDDNGILTVGAGQDLGALTVTATSTVDTVMSGTANVTVLAAPPPPVAVAPPPPAPAVVVPPAPPPAPVPQRRDIMDTSKHRLFAEIHFEPDTAVLIESTRPQLDSAGRYLQANPNLWVLVRTYTAPFGTAEGRFMVALDRARFCRDYFIRNYGIAPERIVTETLASERLPENVVIEEWITYRTAELIMLVE